MPGKKLEAILIEQQDHGIFAAHASLGWSAGERGQFEITFLECKNVVPTTEPQPLKGKQATEKCAAVLPGKAPSVIKIDPPPTQKPVAKAKAPAPTRTLEKSSQPWRNTMSVLMAVFLVVLAAMSCAGFGSVDATWLDSAESGAVLALDAAATNKSTCKPSSVEVKRFGPSSQALYLMYSPVNYSSHFRHACSAYLFTGLASQVASTSPSFRHLNAQGNFRGRAATAEGNQLCAACPARKYQGDEGASACNECGNGFASACNECGNGFTCPEGSVVQIPASCQPGTYLDSASDQCLGCPAASVCAGGASQPWPCTCGGYCVANVSQPTDCPAGSLKNKMAQNKGQNKMAQTSCMACLDGSYCEAASTTIVMWPAGTFGSTTGLPGINECTVKPGFYSTGLTTTVSPDSDGYLNGSTGTEVYLDPVHGEYTNLKKGLSWGTDDRVSTSHNGRSQRTWEANNDLLVASQPGLGTKVYNFMLTHLSGGLAGDNRGMALSGSWVGPESVQALGVHTFYADVPVAHATKAQVSLLFKAEDLSLASPATVSRAGTVYVGISEMGWQPFVDSWLLRIADEVRVRGTGLG